tara:strand:+ start:573 stop:2273 length:1701 start_codon:yes stop_codon:yes gene_type:complete
MQKRHKVFYVRQLAETVRYLKFQQIAYRLYYKIRRKALSRQHRVHFRSFHEPWNKNFDIAPQTYENQTFYFLNQQYSFTDNLTWDDKTKPKLWLYNLHYFDYLNQSTSLGSNEDLQLLISNWIVENPVGYGNGWEPYPLSLRIVNWVKWFSKNPELAKQEYLDSLVVQAEMLSKKIEYHILANHLFANAKALVFAGCFFEGKHADKWLKKGLKILNKQLPEQFLNDGGHFERSPMYHAILLADVCDLYGLAHVSGGPELQEFKPVFEKIIEKGLHWLEKMCHPDGDVSFFNDSVFAIAPSLKAICSYSELLFLKNQNKLQNQIIEPNKSSDWHLTALENSGYFIVEKSDMSGHNKAILDIAPVGPDYQPGHAHADTLSMELSLFGQRFFVNSGISEYEVSSLRQFQRSTKAHNTVCVNEKNSSDVWAGFRVAKRAKPFDVKIKLAGKAVLISGKHNGYKSLPGRNIHQREWLFEGSKIMVTDVISGSFDSASASYYLHPDITIKKIEDKKFICQLRDKKEVFITVVGSCNADIKSSNWYPEFGKCMKNQCLDISFKIEKISLIIDW